MANKLWKPWIGETQTVINRYARWIFASLALTFLAMANVATFLLIAVLIKALLVR